MKNLREEITFMMIKPDGVRRGLTGEIIKRIEKVGLKIVALEMSMPTRELIDNHYPKDEKWITRVGEKTSNTYAKFEMDLQQELGTTDPFEIGNMVRSWLVDFMASGPVVKMIIKGVHAITMVRKMAGPTMPVDAELGTIRGDFSIDSPAIANMEKRPVFNLVHASETPEEAEHEIKHWFGGVKLHDYQRTDDAVFAKP